jgi:2-oxoglutarate ferredoxin oxidoreductase subunit alpha
VPIVAPRSPADCFDAAIEAVRIATTYRTPVFLLSDGYLANGSEPWAVPQVAELPELAVQFATEPNDTDADGKPVFHPFKRDDTTLARPWAVPGTSGLEHRIGGIEKADITGNISYDPDNHDLMTRLRAGKVERIAESIGDLEVDDPSGDADVLVLGWGSTYGPIAAAVRSVRNTGAKVAQAHLRHLNPFPANTGEVLRRYDRVLVPEMNMGQLALLLRAKYLVDVHSFTQVRGLPFTTVELADAIVSLLEDDAATDPTSEEVRA